MFSLSLEPKKRKLATIPQKYQKLWAELFAKDLKRTHKSRDFFIFLSCFIRYIPILSLLTAADRSLSVSQRLTFPRTSASLAPWWTWQLPCPSLGHKRSSSASRRFQSWKPTTAVVDCKEVTKLSAVALAFWLCKSLHSFAAVSWASPMLEAMMPWGPLFSPSRHVKTTQVIGRLFHTTLRVWHSIRLQRQSLEGQNVKADTSHNQATWNIQSSIRGWSRDLSSRFTLKLHPS